LPKFRKLTIEELELLESDFIEFLVINGITAVDWEKIKIQNPEKADILIDGFSDVIFAAILRKVKYLEHLSPKSLKLFCCDEDQILLTGVDLRIESKLSFPENTNITEFIKENAVDLEIYRTQKRYTKDRLVEIYSMMESGCFKTDGKLYVFFNP